MKRLLSLDILRGITVAGMIVVNNGYGESFGALRHSAWNGITPCDLVFPFFLFIMGVSAYLSLSKGKFEANGATVAKILKRTVKILLVGWAIYWFHDIMKGDFFPFAHMRALGVLHRIALCYCIVSLLAITVKHKHFLWLIPALLIGYAAILLLGNGYENTAESIIARFDTACLGSAHLYTKAPIDPEGLLSTISAIAHTMIGFVCGSYIIRCADNGEKVQRIFVLGFCLLTLGWLLTDLLPANKRIWSPSYTLITTGGASMLLATLMYFIDVRGRQKHLTFFHVFGVNPLALYVFSELLAIVGGSTGACDVAGSAICSIIPEARIASAVYAVMFMLICYAVGYVLYKRKIYIKL
mgnify:FL=1